MVALDAQTGATLWTKSAPGLGVGTWLAGDAAYLGYHDRFVAVDLRTGIDRWSTALPNLTALFAHGGTLAVLADDALIALDASNGHERARTKVGSAHGAAHRDGIVYLKVTTGPAVPALNVGALESVLAVDMASLQVMWRTAPYLTLGEPQESLALLGEDVLACTNEGVLRTLDARSGALRATIGLGRCSALLAREHGGQRWVHTLSFSRGDEGPVRLRGGAPSSRTMRVTGVVMTTAAPSPNVARTPTPRAGALVSALDATAVTDAAGRFDMKVGGGEEKGGGGEGGGVGGRPPRRGRERAAAFSFGAGSCEPLRMRRWLGWAALATLAACGGAAGTLGQTSDHDAGSLDGASSGDGSASADGNGSDSASGGGDGGLDDDSAVDGASDDGAVVRRQRDRR